MNKSNQCQSIYYGKLNSLWEDLNKHEPLISCSCCSGCDAGSRHALRRDAQRLHEFLMGLHLDFANLRTNILSFDPLPSLDRAYHLAVQDERLRTSSLPLDKPSNVLGFTVQVAGRGRGRTEHPTCTHCHKPGHDFLLLVPS